MSRKGPATKRKIIADPKYNDRLVSRMITKVMYDGKRSTAEKIVYKAFHIISERTKGDPLKIFKDALDNIKPAVEVKSRRVGGSTYQVPVDVRPERRLTLALRWLVLFSRKRSERTFARRLAGELLDASNGIGASVKKRDDTHRMAEANKAFAHYRW